MYLHCVASESVSRKVEGYRRGLDGQCSVVRQWHTAFHNSKLGMGPAHQWHRQRYRRMSPRADPEGCGMAGGQAAGKKLQSTDWGVLHAVHACPRLPPRWHTCQNSGRRKILGGSVHAEEEGRLNLSGRNGWPESKLGAEKFWLASLFVFVCITKTGVHASHMGWKVCTGLGSRLAALPCHNRPSRNRMQADKGAINTTQPRGDRTLGRHMSTA